MKGIRQRISAKLFAPTDAASLGMFRILFGALMIWQALYYVAKGRFLKYYIEPNFHFTYEFFHFVSPVSQNFLLAVFLLMAAAACGMMFGLFYRVSVFTFLLTYSYVFLLDRAFYNNHYYAIILLSFLLLMANGQRWGSLDQKLRPKPEVIPYWNLFLLKAQIFIIYFYGGIAKLNGDWFRGEPMRSWLRDVSHLPLIGPLFLTEWAPYFFSWGGLAFDLSIGFFLWWRKTRYAAFLVILFFNLTNSVIFNIGVFPFLMIAAATLFDDPDWPRRIFQAKKPAPNLHAHSAKEFRSDAVLVFVGAYLFVQILIPLRHWLYPGDSNWTEEGHYFSWHMKLRDKKGRLKIFITDPKNDSTIEYDSHQDLNRLQRGKMIQRPQFIHQYAQFLKEKMTKQGIERPVIRVDAWVSLNGRPFQRIIDPQVDLAEARTGLFFHDEWIVPLDPGLKPGTLTDESKETEETIETKTPGVEPGVLESEF